jgi:hypothetical protein
LLSRSTRTNSGENGTLYPQVPLTFLPSNDAYMMRSNDRGSFKKYAIIGAVAVIAVVGVLLALGAARAPQPATVQDTTAPPGSVGTGPTEGAGQDSPGPDDGGGTPDTNPEPIPDVTPSASISVGPNPAPAGSEVQIEGSGFGESERITLALNNRVLETEPAEIVTDETGTFSASTTLPEGQQGERNITASDESNRAATIKVDIT